MNGVRIDCTSLEFPGPIAAAVSALLSKYWLVCTQSGPFSLTDKANFEELEEETSSFSVHVPEFRDTDIHLFRSGVFPRFADLLVIDEWTCLFALDGSEESAKQNALKIEECAGGWLSKTFFEAVESSTLGFFMYVDGFWEVYLQDRSRHASLLAQGFAEIHSEHWLNDLQMPV